MGTQKLQLFIDFDDVVIKTRPRLEGALAKVYKYATFFYWDNLRTNIIEEYEKKIGKIRQHEILLHQDNQNKVLLEELYEKEMNLYTEYIRKIDEVEEDIKYLGINIDYVLEVLNNKDSYHDGDNPKNPYYIDYDKILDMCYANPHAIEFVKTVMLLPHIDAKILSHKNCERESFRKAKIIKENIGDIPLHTLYFHRDAFSPVNRQINSKAEYVMNLYGLTELNGNFILIDDSKTNILDWIAHGGIGILFSKNYVEGFQYQISELTYENFSNCLKDKSKKFIKK